MNNYLKTSEIGSTYIRPSFAHFLLGSNEKSISFHEEKVTVAQNNSEIVTNIGPTPSFKFSDSTEKIELLGTDENLTFSELENILLSAYVFLAKKRDKEIEECILIL